MAEKSNTSEPPTVIHLKQNTYGGTFEVVIDRGSTHGIKEGDRYIVYGKGPLIKDLNGTELGTLELVRGRGTIVHVQELMSTLRCTEKGNSRKKRTVPYAAILSTYTSSVIEEDLTSEIPFDGVEVGDRTRKL